MNRDDAELILSEKFAPADLPDVCAPRLRVVDTIERAVRTRRFVYLGAPAGSGKTVSALLWLKQAKRPCVWIGLDRYDDVPSVFYKQLALGLYSVQPGNDGLRAVIEEPGFSLSPVEHLVRLLAEMTPLERRYVLVLDDVHLVENREIRKSLPAAAHPGAVVRLPHRPARAGRAPSGRAVPRAAAHRGIRPAVHRVRHALA